jgi:hypothetical protein
VEKIVADTGLETLNGFFKRVATVYREHDQAVVKSPAARRSAEMSISR